MPTARTLISQLCRHAHEPQISNPVHNAKATVFDLQTLLVTLKESPQLCKVQKYMTHKTHICQQSKYHKGTVWFSTHLVTTTWTIWKWIKTCLITKTWIDSCCAAQIRWKVWRIHTRNTRMRHTHRAISQIVKNATKLRRLLALWSTGILISASAGSQNWTKSSQCRRNQPGTWARSSTTVN